MQLTRPRFYILGFLIVLYLAGVLLLSAVTLHEPKSSSLASSLKATEQTHTSVIRNKALKRTRINWCSELKYQDPQNPTVALVSFPGSGNTWLRYLLQQSTGILTGSIYRDYGLLKNGFPGESVANGTVLLVKTHEWGAESRKRFQKAILLVRSPAPAIQAEFNRQSGGHVGFASPDRYKRMKDWLQFVNAKLQAWRKINMDWLNNFTGPTHVIFYEQLVENTEHTLRTIFDFLGVRLDRSQFLCALERKEGIYRRKKRVLSFDPYSAEMKKRIRNVQRAVYDAIYKIATPTKR